MVCRLCLKKCHIPKIIAALLPFILFGFLMRRKNHWCYYIWDQNLSIKEVLRQLSTAEQRELRLQDVAVKWCRSSPDFINVYSLGRRRSWLEHLYRLQVWSHDPVSMPTNVTDIGGTALAAESTWLDWQSFILMVSLGHQITGLPYWSTDRSLRTRY